jgi:uncharacterized protein (TIGR02246 family)
MNLEAEKDRLLQRDVEWAAVASEGRDIERILSYWTDDAIVLPPGQPAVVGKAALRQFVEASLQIPGFGITWTSADVSLSADGNLAYILSKRSVTVTGPDGTPMTRAGPLVTIWHREADGTWRCAVDIWNSESAA